MITSSQYPAGRTCAPSVLLAEDNTDLRELYECALIRTGFEVTAVSNGLDALTHLDSRSFDLVLVDRTLPGVGGVTVLRQMRRSHDPDVPALMISHLSRSVDIVTGYAAGANSYLGKDVGLRTIIDEAWFLARAHQLARSRTEDTD